MLRTICCKNVSSPTRLTSTSSVPEPLMAPPMTSSPSFFFTGIDSPVTSDSSTAERPEATRPSMATRSPGRTRMRSPTPTALIGTSPSTPSRTSRAVSGCSSSSFFTECELWVRTSSVNHREKTW